MVDLSESELQLRILGSGDGPAAFNAVLSKKGGKIVSFDPIYAFNAAQIRSRIAETYEMVMAQIRNNQTNYIWDAVSSIEDPGRIRMCAMDAFLLDFRSG